MTKEYSFAGVRSKALWFPYPLSPNNVTYASHYFIAIPFFETFFFIQNGIPRFRIFRHYADPPFFHSIFQLYNSRYRISQLARFAN